MSLYTKAVEEFKVYNNITDPRDLLLKYGFIKEPLGATISSIIDNKEFINALIYTLFILAKVDEKYIFSHGSLSMDNIYVVKDTSKKTISLGETEYILECNYAVHVRIITDKMLLVYKGVPIIENGDYSPGMDLYMLLKSVIDGNPDYKWMLDYLGKGMDKTHSLYRKGISFFIQWLRTNKSELFGSTSESFPIKLQKRNLEVELPSAILALLFSKNPDINNNKIDYDRKCISMYSTFKNLKYIPDTDYNLPIEKNEKSFLDFYTIESSVKLYQAWYSINEEIKNNKSFSELNKEITSVKIGMYNLYLAIKRYLYSRNYSIFRQLKNIEKCKDHTGDSLSILNNEKNIIDSVFNLKYLMDSFKRIFNAYKYGTIPRMPEYDKIYFSPATLEQITRVYKRLPKLLESLILKHLPDKNTLEIINSGENDIQIYTKLRKYVVKNDFDRGQARVRDVSLFFNKKEWQDYLSANPDISFLDFGGNDGSISASFASFLKLNKNNAYSADIGVWYDRVQQRKFDQITFITLEPDKPIPLADKSIDVITAFQVFHHIENIDFVLSELHRICKKFLIMREHDCRDNTDKMLIDIEHSLYEVTIEEKENIRFLNDYSADYKSVDAWDSLMFNHGFKKINTLFQVKGPTRYYYRVYIV